MTRARHFITVLVLGAAYGAVARPLNPPRAEYPPITAPPESFFEMVLWRGFGVLFANDPFGKMQVAVGLKIIDPI